MIVPFGLLVMNGISVNCGRSTLLVVAYHNLDGVMAGFNSMYFLYNMLPFPVSLNACGHFCGAYFIVVVFVCHVLSLSVGVHGYWVLLNLVLFAMLIFLMYAHTSYFSGRCFMAVIFVGHMSL